MVHTDAAVGVRSRQSDKRQSERRLTLNLDTPRNVAPYIKVLVFHPSPLLIWQAFDMHHNVPLKARALDEVRLVGVCADRREVAVSRGGAYTDSKLWHS